ncbi:MAG: adenylosuccinate lyase [Synergistetes bacterium]|nr:adenylosuccinate lyase [Synergistota bacterium]
MIERYTTKEMCDVWSGDNKYNKWLDVELAVLEGWASVGKVSWEDVEYVKKHVSFSVSGIKDREAVLHHDVAAFVDEISDGLGERGRYIHYGITSSDILDTSLALILKEALYFIFKELDELANILLDRAREFKYLPIVGRTHGVHAEPTTFGLKLLSYYTELLRNRKRLLYASESVLVGKISGAVGNYANVPPEVEKYALEKLGLRREPVATQVVGRDRYAFLVSALSVLASGLERVALQIRLLSRTETAEVREAFGRLQKGSSAMPHKKNPVNCERVCGMARLLRGYILPILENVALWDERDISHSSVERVVLPDATTIVHFMLKDMKRIVSGMVVDGSKMGKNLWWSKGLVFSQRVLLELINRGMERADAYRIVQSAAFDVENKGVSFKEALKDKVSFDVDPVFDVHYYMRHVDDIFDRVIEGGEYE